MDPRIREIIDTSRYCQGTVAAVSKLLPEDDALLDEWIGSTVTTHDQNGFVYLVFAAVHLERKVSARHLSRGLSLLPEYMTLGCVAWHMEGDNVPEHLLAGLQYSTVNGPMKATALLIAAEWCKERREGAIPPEVFTVACLLARTKKLDGTTRVLLIALSRTISEPRLLEILGYDGGLPEQEEAVLDSAKKLGAAIMKVIRGPIFALINEAPQRIITGITERRSVAHIGRNEPCPCGSGKKYKRCCIEKDQERLRQSSPVAGKTYAELWADPEPHLTAALLEKITVNQLARLDPTKLAPDLLEPYFIKIASCQLYEEMAESFEKMGCPPALHEVWHYAMWQCMRFGRKDIAERLMHVRGGTLPEGERMPPGFQLLLVRDDPSAFLKLLEELATQVLKTKEAKELQEIAFGILCSPLRGLGVLVARSMIPITSKKDATFLLDQILDARLKLNMSLDEPFADILDKRFAEEGVKGGGKDTEALRTARQNLAAKVGEVQQMKQTLEQLRAEIERREKAPPPPVLVQPEKPAPVAPAEPVDEKALRELREKVSALKSDLKQRHNERAALRRELDKTVTDLETLRAKQKQADPHDAHAPSADHEDHLLLPGDVDGNQPVRLIEFPKRFHDTLASFPRPVSRAAMVMIGRLAAGEPAAFVGVVRLKDTPNTLRVRIGLDHRLLFRLQSDTLQIVDLINRKDLEKRIRTL